MTNTPIDRESVERLADRLSKPQSAIRPTVSDSRDGAKTLLALRAALDAAEAENKRLREALRKIGENAKICAYGSDHIICHNCSDTHHAVDAALQENHDD